MISTENKRFVNILGGMSNLKFCCYKSLCAMHIWKIILSNTPAKQAAVKYRCPTMTWPLSHPISKDGERRSQSEFFMWVFHVRMTLARGGKKNENRDGMQRYNGACVFLIEEEPHHHVHRFANASATSVHTLPFAISINAHTTNSVPYNTRRYRLCLSREWTSISSRTTRANATLSRV